MQTIRQIERFWSGRQYDRLARELLTARVEFSDRLAIELAQAVPAAALAVIRLDELNQGYHPLNEKFIRTIIAGQDEEGGWGDPMVSALCIRALMCGQGRGVVIDRGIAHLASLQKPEGCWPAVPVRRTTGDAFVSAFILFQLADHEAFRSAIRFDDAAKWFEQNEHGLSDEARRLWRRVGLRCRINRSARTLVGVGSN